MHRGTDRETGRAVAVKVIPQDQYTAHAQQHASMRREIEILQGLTSRGGHPHIVQVLDAYDTGPAVHIVMEFIGGGQLFDKVVELGCYTEVDAACVIYRLVATLEFLHAHGVMHRDLKPENILLVEGSTTDIKLIDFGMSQLTQSSRTLRSKCGTPVYMAPEMFSQKYDESVDIWAAGVILYIMLGAVLPFYSDNVGASRPGASPQARPPDTLARRRVRRARGQRGVPLEVLRRGLEGQLIGR